MPPKRTITFPPPIRRKRRYTLHPRTPYDMHHRGEHFGFNRMGADDVEDISDDDDVTPPVPLRRPPPPPPPPPPQADNELRMTPALSKLIDDVVSREFPGLTEESVMSALTSPAAQAAVAAVAKPPQKRARITNIRLVDDDDKYVVSPPRPALVVRPVLRQARPTAPTVNNNNNGSASLVNTLIPLAEHTQRQKQKKAEEQRKRDKKAEDALDEFTAELLSMPAKHEVPSSKPRQRSPEERARESVATLLRNAEEIMKNAAYKRYLKTHRGSTQNTQDSP